MPVLNPETLTQVSDFKDPNIFDVFEFEEIFDANGFPYLAFSPNDYNPAGPQMALGLFPTDDITKRRQHGGIINTTERRNAQEHFGEAMDILRSLRGAYIFNERAELPLTNSDALRIAHTGIELPRYLLWQQNPDYLNGELPPPAILLNRALRGFHGVVDRESWGWLAKQEHRQEYLRQPFSADALAEVIVDRKSLESNLVCAGHWNMITEMLRIIEGEAQSRVVAAEVAYHPASLMDFAKSLRTIWDVTFPGIEHATKLEQGGEIVLDADEEEKFRMMLLMTAMANQLIRRVIGQDPDKPLDPQDMTESFLRYSARGDLREEELVAAIKAYRMND